MKTLITAILLFAFISSSQAQRIRDLTNLSTADSLAYLVVDKSGWSSYKKIRADVFYLNSSTKIQTFIDSIKTATGLIPSLSYVPFATSHYIQSADFTYRSLAQNIKNSTFLLDYVLDSLSQKLRVLQDTSTYRILNKTNELGQRFAGQQYKTATNKFLMSGVTGTGYSNAFMAFFDTAANKRHSIAVDTSKIALRFNQTIAGAGDYDRINMQDTGIVLQRKLLTVNNYMSVTDKGIRFFMKGERVLDIDSSGYSWAKHVYHLYSGFQDSVRSIALTASTWAHLTNAGKNIWATIGSDGITETSDTITIQKEGVYAGTMSITYDGTNINEYQFRIYNVTATRQEGYKQGGSAVAGNYTNVTLPVYINAASANTKIVIQVQNITGSNAIIIRHGQLNLYMIHE